MALPIPSSVQVATSDSVGPNKSFADGLLNSSGWTVATSGAKANGQGTMTQWAMYAAVGVMVLLVVIKRKRK